MSSRTLRTRPWKDPVSKSQLEIIFLLAFHSRNANLVRSTLIRRPAKKTIFI